MEIKKIDELISFEQKRQNETLTLIPSENYASRAVREAMGSVLANKYAEGYPGKRYYQGNKIVDELETECRKRACQLFGAVHANVQPLSGSVANLAILWALRKGKDDIQLSQDLSSGGHLSMGQNMSMTSVIMKPEHYHLTLDGQIDWEELKEKTLRFKPRVIWSGGTAYTKIFDWEKYREIADLVGAYFVADISHIGGLVAGGAHPCPMSYADLVMTTTHKSLRGPRGAMILVSDRGIKKDSELSLKIDKAVFPGVQGGPHMETVAALAVALEEAARPEFSMYAKQVVLNAKGLASELLKRGYKLVGGGTDNHMVWVDLTDKKIDGWMAAYGLEQTGVITNRQTVPNEKRSAYYPSGLRLGTPAATTRGMEKEQMIQIAGIIDEVLVRIEEIGANLKIGGNDKTADQIARKEFKELITKDEKLKQIKTGVLKIALDFPIPS